MKDGRNRKDIAIGSKVAVVQKNHQRTGELTTGVISRILTKSPNHPHGIKVELASGIVGRVKNIIG
ncbi:MAG: YwbE family protein [Tenacibaculum sp.]